MFQRIPVAGKHYIRLPILLWEFCRVMPEVSIQGNGLTYHFRSFKDFLCPQTGLLGSKILDKPNLNPESEKFPSKETSSRAPLVSPLELCICPNEPWLISRGRAPLEHHNVNSCPTCDAKSRTFKSPKCTWARKEWGSPWLPFKHAKAELGTTPRFWFGYLKHRLTWNLERRPLEEGGVSFCRPRGSRI